MQYNIYHLKPREVIMAVLLYILFSALVGILFYNTVWFVIAASPILIFVFRWERERRCRQRTEQLKQEFKEFMLSMATALNAGYALENTFPVIREDLLRAFPKKQCYLAEECQLIQRGLSMKRPVEGLLMDLGERSGIAEIRDFARVIAIAKQTGGNMIQIIRSTASQMREVMEVRQEIGVMVAAKAFEQKIMLIVPFGIIGYLRLSNPGYLDCLYGNIVGITIMTACLLVIWLSYRVSKRILNIEVEAASVVNTCREPGGLQLTQYKDTFTSFTGKVVKRLRN